MPVLHYTNLYPNIGILQYLNRGSREGLSSSPAVPCTFMSTVPQEFTRLKMKNVFGQGWHLIFGTALLVSGKLPLAPTTSPLPLLLKSVWHPLSYAPFLHLPHKCPWSHRRTLAPEVSVGLTTCSPTSLVQVIRGWLVFLERNHQWWAAVFQRMCSTT